MKNLRLNGTGTRKASIFEEGEKSLAIKLP